MYNYYFGIYFNMGLFTKVNGGSMDWCKEWLAKIIGYKGGCCDHPYCMCEICFLFESFCLKMHNADSKFDHAMEESQNLIYKEAIKVFIERYGKDELLEVLI